MQSSAKMKATGGGIPPPFKGKSVRRIDPGIALEVRVLWENGIETTESCEGGPGHSFSEPTVRFCGIYADGLRAVAIALTHGLKVRNLRRSWTVDSGELTGPEWEMTFYRMATSPPRSASRSPGNAASRRSR